LWTCKFIEEHTGFEVATPSEAQPWCNFVVLVPTVFPSDSSLDKDGSLRKEARPIAMAKSKSKGKTPSSLPSWTSACWSSYRLTISDSKGRKLSVKQCLHDLLPPQSDHPELYAQKAKAIVNADQPVIWLGQDQNGCVSASSIVCGTWCELTVLSGVFSQDELVQVVNGLKPADSLAAFLISQTALKDLAYTARHGAGDLGCFKRASAMFVLNNIEGEISCRWYLPQDLDKKQAKQLLMLKDLIGWTHDSLCVWSVGEDVLIVDDYFYLAGRDKYMILRWSPFSEENCVISFPPKVDPSLCQKASRLVQGQRIWQAYLNEEYGPHEAIWNTDERVVLLQTNASANGTTMSFLRLVEKVLSATMSSATA
jgi:hypothetical protein